MPRGNAKNLKKGDNHGNKGRGSAQDRKDAAEIRKISKKLLSRPGYQAKLIEKLEDGTLHPSIQNMLWYYAYGKPLDVLDEKKVANVEIQMVLDPGAAAEAK